MIDLEKLLRTADFTAGSDHKERLRRTLFGADAPAMEELTDDDLGLVAAGQGTPLVIPEESKQPR